MEAADEVSPSALPVLFDCLSSRESGPIVVEVVEKANGVEIRFFLFGESLPVVW